MKWNPTFYFKEKQLYYNRILFNNLGERCIEIPIAFDFLANLKPGSKVMEVGNVLSHYENALSEHLGLRNRRIIDKFEVEIGVDNVDLMEITSGERYDAIVSISTAEHIGQGAEPSSGAYGEEEVAERDLEAPLKAIGKIYELLEIGGQALITVPFGKLIDAGWFIQFDRQYLDLIVSKYQIPTTAITFHFFKKLRMDLRKNNSRQEWVLVEDVKLDWIEFNWPFPCANAIAAIELTKSAEPFALQLDAPPTAIAYHSHYPVQRNEYADLLKSDFIECLENLREINLIFFPDWSQSEDLIFSELEKVIQSVLNHPDRDKILLLVDASAVSEDDANLVLTGVMMNLLAQERVDVDSADESGITLLGKLSAIQQRALLLQLHCQIVLESSQKSKQANALDDRLPTFDIDRFTQGRAIQLESGVWDLK